MALLRCIAGVIVVCFPEGARIGRVTTIRPSLLLVICILFVSPLFDGTGTYSYDIIEASGVGTASSMTAINLFDLTQVITVNNSLHIMQSRVRDKGPDGAERGTFFPGNRPRETFTPENFLFHIFGPLFGPIHDMLRGILTVAFCISGDLFEACARPHTSTFKPALAVTPRQAWYRRV